MNQDEITAAVGKILQNPEFVGLVRELQGDRKGGGEPDLMTQLPEVLSRLEPILGSVESGSSGETVGEEKAQQTPENVRKEPSDPPKHYDKARAEKLMSAIKPYLKPERCEIIDKCMSAMQLTDVIGILRELEGSGKGKS